MLRRPTAPARFWGPRNNAMSSQPAPCPLTGLAPGGPVAVAHGLALAGADRMVPQSRQLAEEVAVAVVVNGSTLAVLMASPADIADFAHGFLLTEGIVTCLTEIDSYAEVAHPQGLEARFWLCADRAEALARRRRAMAGPVGCGLCGIDSLAEALRPLPRVTVPGPLLAPAEVMAAGHALRAGQRLHDQTRAAHAAGFLKPGAGILALREDIGRHNALDKLIGHLWRSGIAPGQGAVIVTSRLSVELVQKAAVAGIPALIAVSAPTAAALRAATAAGITLIANLRKDGFDLMAHPQRLKGGLDDA